MKLTQKRVTIVLCALLLVNTPKIALAKEPKAPCRLQVENAHISTYEIKFNNRRVVKVNAFSICNLPQSNVSIDVDLWKVGTFGPSRVIRSKTTFPGTTNARVKLINQKTFELCKNRTPTYYYGVAYSKAFIAGKWQYARHTLSDKPILLKCGTWYKIEMWRVIEKWWSTSSIS